MPSACAPTVGARRLERRHRRLLLTRRANLTRPGELGVELGLAAEQAAAGNAHVVEHDLGRVARPDPMLQILLSLRQTLRLRRHDERRVAAPPQLRLDGGDDDVDVGNAAIGDPRFRAVQHPLVVRCVVDGARPQ